MYKGNIRNMYKGNIRKLYQSSPNPPYLIVSEDEVNCQAHSGLQ